MPLTRDGSIDLSSCALKVMKCTPTVDYQVFLSNARPVFMETHWFHKSFLCAGDECIGCQVMPRRRVAYFVVDRLIDGHACRNLVLCSPRSWLAFVQRTEQDHQEITPGLALTLSRRFSNSALQILPQGMRELEWQLPFEKCELVAAIAVLHKISPPANAETLEVWDESTAQQRNFAMKTAISEIC